MELRRSKVPIREKLYITMSDAYNYTGLSRAEISRRIALGLWRTTRDGARTKIVRVSIDENMKNERSKQ